MFEICRQLEWDSQLFEQRIARIEYDRLTSTQLAQALKWCGEQRIDCLYFLCTPEDNASVLLAETAGFHFVDIRIELNWNVELQSLPLDTAIREFHEPDLAALRKIASQVYGNTRFGYDNRFSADRVSKLYQEWLNLSCQNPLHKVFVATGKDYEDGVAGFITCQFDDPEIGRIGLLGLGDNAQGKGLGHLLVQTAQQFFHSAGAHEVRVVTQGRNISAQRLYQRCGFRTQKVGLWYHKWF
ncbi:MAG: GNAT family N-acetyltransferase [Acidobacteriota bacterium]|nr:GNAT family N-acetyltransferase [Acidobacteriota bacterium]